MHDDRKRQVKTTRERYGKDHYPNIGSVGGKKSAAKFTPEQRSERSKAAANARWAKYKEQKEKEKR